MNLEQSNPLVTVYIPTYNRVDLLKRAVESVRQQIYQNLEIIIVDDCSTDGTHEYLEDISKQDSRIRFFLKEKNSGACASRNIAIENAKGEYITGLDDDDYFTKDRLKIFIENWNEDPSIKALSAMIAVKMNEAIIFKFHSKFTGKNKISSRDLLKNNYAGNQIFTKTKFLKDIGGFDVNFRMWQDLECWYNLIKNGGYIRKIKRYTYIQDVSHEYSRITASNRSKLEETFENFITKHELKGLDAIFLKSHFFNYGYSVVPVYIYIYKFLDGFHLVDIIRLAKIILRVFK